MGKHRILLRSEAPGPNRPAFHFSGSVLQYPRFRDRAEITDQGP